MLMAQPLRVELSPKLPDNYLSKLYVSIDIYVRADGSRLLKINGVVELHLEIHFPVTARLRCPPLLQRNHELRTSHMQTMAPDTSSYAAICGCHAPNPI
mmetsp:Transcript_69134/g.114933  ORF Transcript_69134/g.114933 Transcript_69134/m.114933 type:complete len:99 (+) Transcript_69134:195-491(+)